MASTRATREQPPLKRRSPWRRLRSLPLPAQIAIVASALLVGAGIGSATQTQRTTIKFTAGVRPSTPIGSDPATTTTPPTTTAEVPSSASPAPAPSADIAPAAPAAPTPPAPTPTTGNVPADMLNLSVTQATISTTICVSGYTTTIRPSSSVTGRIKVAQIASYGYADTSTADYEEDHVVSLELGGAPASISNLYPEPHSFSTGDDATENRLHAAVCAHTLDLAAAQSQILALKTAHGYNRTASTATVNG